MKAKSILLIIAMACSLAASAYVPLVREGVKWVYYWEYDNSPDYGIHFKCEYAMEVLGDSVVNGVTYKKVYLHPLSKPIGSSKPYALVREENKVVYIHMNPENDIWYYWEIVERSGSFPLVAGKALNEWVLYDFNNVDRPFSNITVEQIEMSGYDIGIPEYIYSETIELQGESAKVYTGHFPTPYLIEGLGYVGEVGMTDLCGWVYLPSDVIAPAPIGYPLYFYAFSYFADAEGNVLYKGPAYTYMCDVNEDKKVDGSDLNLLINAVLTGNKRYNYDANGDSAVDGADINEVINFILKK